MFINRPVPPSAPLQSRRPLPTAAFPPAQPNKEARRIATDPGTKAQTVADPFPAMELDENQRGILNLSMDDPVECAQAFRASCFQMIH